MVEPNGFPDYRYNDREIIRAFADNSAATYEWLVAHGVVFVDKAPDAAGGNAVGNSVPREMHCRRHGLADGADRQAGRSRGAGDDVVRQRADAAAGSRGRESRRADPAASTGWSRCTARRRMRAACSGSRWNTTARRLAIRARKAVIIATGGSTGNVNFRRMADPRLTEEYCGLSGMPWSDQDASGEIAAMAIGASLWGMLQPDRRVRLQRDQAGHHRLPIWLPEPEWMPGSSVFDRARATGLRVHDWQNVDHGEHAGPAVLRRDRARRSRRTTTTRSIPTRQGSYRNAKDVTCKPNNWLNAAMAGIGDGHNGGGPIWAIFDADAVARENWVPTPPHVDIGGGFFFSADTLGDLARKIAMKYQRVPMPPEGLEKTVARYNSFVESGRRADTSHEKAPMISESLMIDAP